MSLTEPSDSSSAAESSVQERRPPRSVPDEIPHVEAAPAPEVGAPPAASVPSSDTPDSPLRLRGICGEYKGREWWLPKAFVVGRSATCGLVLADSSVSHKHAYFWRSDAGWWFADLGSTNGTYVNGNRIGMEPVGPLTRRTIIQFGKVGVIVGEVTRPTRSWSDLVLPAFWSGTETVRVGAPNRSGPLTVFPLFHPAPKAVDYVLSDEAIAGGWLTVSEISAEGRVSELAVENRGERRVLFLEGEELRGGKQNRVLNASVMVPARGVIRVPVSCVEKGRWSPNAHSQMGTGTVSSSRIRHALRSSVTRSLQGGTGHTSDQSTIWGEVQTQHDSLGVTSTTGSMSDTIVDCAERVRTIHAALPYIDGSSGLVVAVGTKIVSVDLFDSPTTCRRVWDRLLSGLSIDGLMAGAEAGQPAPEQITALFTLAAGATWVDAAAVGEGTERRASIGEMAGSALTVDGVLIHGGLVAGKQPAAK